VRADELKSMGMIGADECCARDPRVARAVYAVVVHIENCALRCDDEIDLCIPSRDPTQSRMLCHGNTQRLDLSNVFSSSYAHRRMRGSRDETWRREPVECANQLTVYFPIVSRI
jgi:hypothetical protein